MSVVLKLALDQTMVWMGQGIQELMDVNLVVEIAVCWYLSMLMEMECSTSSTIY